VAVVASPCPVAAAPAAPCRASRSNGREQALLDACRSFEACLIQMLLGTAGMDKHAGILGPGGIAQETHGYMWARALAESVAEGGGLGLAEVLADGLEAGFGTERGDHAAAHSL
jgi:Rod binding domain-containing protein